MTTADRTLERWFRTVREGSVDELAAALDDDPALANAFDPNPWCCRATPLNVAVGASDRARVELLLERGADPDLKSDWWAGGFSPLDSVKHGDPAGLVPVLREAGAVMREHAAAHLGLVDELEAILDRWPMRVNAPGGDGGRPLHFAATPEIAELLLDRGAWIEARDVDHGSTPAQWAVGDRPEVSRTLLDHGAVSDPLMLAAVDDVERLTALLAADPSTRDHRLTDEAYPAPGSKAGHMYRYLLGGPGISPLHAAARTGAVRAVRLLLEAGAHPDDPDGPGDAPLHRAACHDRVGVIDVLLDAGAEIDRLSGEPHFSSPLVWARACGAEAAEATLTEWGAQAVVKGD